MKEIGVAILAGGLSSRMGTSKEDLLLQSVNGNVTFLQHICEEVKGFPYKYLSENSEKSHRIKGFVSIQDKVDKIGPLGGIYSVLIEAEVEEVLFLACDMPGLTGEVVNAFLKKWDHHSVCVAVVDGKRQPLMGIYTKQCIPFIKRQIKSGNYRLCSLLDAVNCKQADMSEYREAFLNVKTEQDYSLYKIYQVRRKK